MVAEWFRGRSYRHFDVPVSPTYAANAKNPAFVAAHPFSPLITYEKRERRYKPKLSKTTFKLRPIMYASHRDACILAYYAWRLGGYLEDEYLKRDLSANVIAYRRLGKANYHFSAEALQYAIVNAPVTVLAFDVSGFFDNLDHGLLKRRLMSAIGVSELSPDWYAVFRHVTKYRMVELDELKAHPVFAERIASKKRAPIATIRELKESGILIKPNVAKFGIPQGTPISSVLANLYMIDFDQKIAEFCKSNGCLYRRYSDDILVICQPDRAAEVEDFVEAAVRAERLEFQSAKTERTLFEKGSPHSAQYLGFSLGPSGASIRPSSLSRQWRKLRRSTKRIKALGDKAIADGKATKIYTRKLRKRFSPVSGGIRNFSAYARRSASAHNSKAIIRQARRLERELDAIIDGFK